MTFAENELTVAQKATRFMSIMGKLREAGMPPCESPEKFIEDLSLRADVLRSVNEAFSRTRQDTIGYEVCKLQAVATRSVERIAEQVDLLDEAIGRLQKARELALRSRARNFLQRLGERLGLSIFP